MLKWCSISGLRLTFRAVHISKEKEIHLCRVYDFWTLKWGIMFRLLKLNYTSDWIKLKPFKYMSNVKVNVNYERRICSISLYRCYLFMTYFLLFLNTLPELLDCLVLDLFLYYTAALVHALIMGQKVLIIFFCVTAPLTEVLAARQNTGWC